MKQIKVTWKAFGEFPERGKFITSVEFEIDVAPLGLTEEDVNQSICEGIYQATNLYGGGYWNLIQPKLSENRTHTALSIGDEVEIDGAIYVCADIGFIKVQREVNA